MGTESNLGHIIVETLGHSDHLLHNPKTLHARFSCSLHLTNNFSHREGIKCHSLIQSRFSFALDGGDSCHIPVQLPITMKRVDSLALISHSASTQPEKVGILAPKSMHE